LPVHLSRLELNPPRRLQRLFIQTEPESADYKGVFDSAVTPEEDLQPN
jgi:hypothetical protein